MSPLDVENEVQELNLTYLLLAQRLIQEDRDTAMLRLKIDGEIADLIMSLSARQIAQLASSSQLLCRLAFDSAEQLGRVVNNERERGLSQTHAAILLASAKRTQLDDSNDKT